MTHVRRTAASAEIAAALRLPSAQLPPSPIALKRRRTLKLYDKKAKEGMPIAGHFGLTAAPFSDPFAATRAPRRHATHTLAAGPQRMLLRVAVAALWGGEAWRGSAWLTGKRSSSVTSGVTNSEG